MDISIPTTLSGAFRRRPVDADKYCVGTVAVVGGSAGFPHAPVIAALGARAAGAGLIRLSVAAASRMAAGALVPEATLAELGEEVPKADVTVVGMGLGVSAEAERIVAELLATAGKRLVVDADALTMLAGSKLKLTATATLTPHEGEAARLLGCGREEVHADRLAAAREIASRYRANCVLKGHHTLVVSADGKQEYENTTGNPFMALGGMGDLLAGVIGARWAYLQGDGWLAASSAAWLHGAAGDAVIAERKDPSILNIASAIGAQRVKLDL